MFPSSNLRVLIRKRLNSRKLMHAKVSCFAECSLKWVNDLGPVFTVGEKKSSLKNLHYYRDPKMVDKEIILFYLEQGIQNVKTRVMILKLAVQSIHKLSL